MNGTKDQIEKIIIIKKVYRAACHLAHRSRQMEFGLGGCDPTAHKPAKADPAKPRHPSMEGMMAVKDRTLLDLSCS